MKLLNNKKGMTLVEIIVVLLIMSILLVIMGSLILNAFSYFNKTTNQDINKRSLDSISEYIRDELLYASDVRVQAEKPNEEDWYTLYIVDGKLYKDDEQIYTDGFYNDHTLTIEVRGFEKYRLDLNYDLKDSDSMSAYGTGDTLELLNLKINVENNDFDPFSNISTKTNITDKIKIYYQKKVKENDAVTPIDPDEGTVADQLECLNFHNNRMDFNPMFGNGKVNYRKGDMVFYEGYWWQACVDIGENEQVVPGSTRHLWKKISGQFDETSCYTVGDIIYIKENDEILYFKCINDCINKFKTPKPDISRPYDDWKNFWVKCEQPEKLSIQCLPYTKAYQEDKGSSVVYKILEYLQQNSLTLEDIPVFGEDGVNNHKKGDFVKVYDEVKGIYRYFLKLDNGQEHQNKPGKQPSSNNKLIWQEMKMDWDEFSGYVLNDIIYSDVYGYLKEIDKKDDTEYGPNITNIGNPNIWEKLYIY